MLSFGLWWIWGKLVLANNSRCQFCEGNRCSKKCFQYFWFPFESVTAGLSEELDSMHCKHADFQMLSLSMYSLVLKSIRVWLLVKNSSVFKKRGFMTVLIVF